MKIVLTGANGQLGRAICQLLKDSEKDVLIATLRNPESVEVSFPVPVETLDITNQEEVERVIKRYQPDVIINGAAYTQVDQSEDEEEKARVINEDGVKYLAMAAQNIGAKFVHVSTDYVFDGEGTEPYTEESETNPLGAYGRTKRAGEIAAQKYCDKTFIVRTAWLYGEGKNFVNTMLRLADNHSTISVVNDQTGTPTSAMELAKMILFLIQTEKYGIYHGTCEGSATWYEFAVEIMKQFGKDVEVVPITTDQFPTKTKRPKYSVLDNKKLNEETEYRMKNWKDALIDFRKQRRG